MQHKQKVGPAPSAQDLMLLKPRAYWGTFLRESLAFKIACIYLMFEYVRPQTIYTAIDILPYGLLSLVGGFAVVLFSKEERSLPTYGSKLPLLLVFLTHVLITILLSRFPDEGFKQLPTLIAWIIAYYLITKSVNNERRLIFFYVLFLLFSLKMSQHGFRSWVASGFGFNKEGVTGAPGWFHNSGEVGIQMCIFLPMALHFLWAGWRSWSKWQRAMIAVMPLSAIGTVVASSSRGAMIGSAAALLWILCKSKYKVRGLLGLAAVAIVVLAVLPDQFAARFDTMGQDNSSKLRLEYWAFGLQKMQEHPLFGIGYFNWIPVYSEHLAASGINRLPEVVHNIFIQAGSELGYTGLILVVIMILSTFVLNARTRRVVGTDESRTMLVHFSHGLDAGMVGFVISAQFVTVLYYPYLWIAIALTVALHSVARHQAEAVAKKSGARLRVSSRLGRKAASSAAQA